MKEHPILMQGWGVRTTLDGRKSQTRRVIKPQAWSYANDALGQQQIYARSGPEDFGDPTPIRCPYGQPGDLLWVRETWAPNTYGSIYINYRYKANGETLEQGQHWKPSIFMPKAAARIWRRITDIRAEQVQDISDEDCYAEGVENINPLNYGERDDTMRGRFGCVWESINKKPKLSKRNPRTRAPEDCYVSYPWEDIQETREHRGLPWYVIGNPYVWAIISEKADQ